MTRREVVIGHRLGLHARASAELVQLSQRFRSEIRIVRSDRGPEADARSILGILLLAAGYGTQVEVRATGDDELAAVGAICEYLAGPVPQRP
jgi:phosphocarrier protein